MTRRLFFSAAMLLVSASCGSQTVVQSESTPVGTQIPAADSLLLDTAIALRTTEGPIALWFWAPGCSSCHAQARSVEEAFQKYGDKVTFFGVAWNGSREAMHSFIDRHALTFPSIEDQSSEIFAEFGVPYQPAWVFIDADGQERRVQGRLSVEALGVQISALVGESN